MSQIFQFNLNILLSIHLVSNELVQNTESVVDGSHLWGCVYFIYGHYCILWRFAVKPRPLPLATRSVVLLHDCMGLLLALALSTVLTGPAGACVRWKKLTSDDHGARGVHAASADRLVSLGRATHRRRSYRHYWIVLGWISASPRKVIF